MMAYFVWFFLYFAGGESVSLPLKNLKGAALTAHLEGLIRQQGGTPVIANNVFHFLYRSEQGEAPRIDGDFNYWSRRQDQRGVPMTPLGEGWYHFGVQALPQARLDYVFLFGEERRLDPRNSHKAERWSGEVSVTQMPDFPEHPELTKQPLRRGKLEKLRFKSELRRNERDVHVYTPPGYEDGQGNYPVLFFGDGTLYVERGKVPQVLDNLIADKTIPPVMAVFIDPVERWLEYRMFTLYRGMVLNELIPYLRDRWRIDARQQVMIGSSRGGLSALDMVLTHPDQFMGCVAFAPAVTETDFSAQLQRLDVDKRPKFSIMIGSFDYWKPSGLEVLEIMQKKGYQVKAQEKAVGHSLYAWVAYLDDVLPVVFGNEVNP